MNTTRFIDGIHYHTLEPIRVTLTGNIITCVAPLPLSAAIDASSLPTLAPGLFDLQVNGAGGVDFNELGVTGSAPGGAARAAAWLASRGTTRFLATFITASEASLLRALRALAAEVDTAPAESLLRSALAGVHLEGPFISALDGFRGAHPAADVAPECDWERFVRAQEASGGRVRLVTLAPEVPGAIDFIARAAASGVAVAVGHSAARSSDFAAAAAAGATIATHVGNAVPGTLPRHPNPLWDALACDDLSPSLIADGHHLPPSFLAVALRASRTPFLVSDATAFSGSPPGRYDAHIGGAVELDAAGRLSVVGGSGALAGAVLPLAAGVGVAAAALAHRAPSTAAALAAAWDLASLAPAAALGRNTAVAKVVASGPRGLEVNAAADIVAFDWVGSQAAPQDGVRIRRVWVSGRAVGEEGYTEEEAPSVAAATPLMCPICGCADALGCAVCGAFAIACSACAPRAWRAHIGLGGDAAGVTHSMCAPPAAAGGLLGGPRGLRGAIAIVTGGSGGMGPTIGAALAARGIGTIIFAQRDCARATSAVAGAVAAGATALAMPLDVSSRDSVDTFFAAFCARFARLDVLVNVAGDCPRTAIGDVSEEEFDKVGRVNAEGPLWMCQAARPLLWSSGGGAIVNIGSLAGEDGANAASIAYTMAKAALRGMMMQLAKEGFPAGTVASERGAAPLIRVNNVSPGPVATEMLKSMDATRLAAITAATLTGRITGIDEVAAAVAYLAIDAVNLTGQTLQLSGGVLRR